MDKLMIAISLNIKADKTLQGGQVVSPLHQKEWVVGAKFFKISFDGGLLCPRLKK